MNPILAIDQSTSATKALLFSPSGQVLAKASRDHRQIYPKPGWVEHDAEEIWENTLAVAKEVVARHASPLRLSITNQRETIVIFDRESGRPLHNAIVWQCRRGVELCQRLKANSHEAMVRLKSGLMLDPYFSASKLWWLLEEFPSIRRAVEDGSALIGTMDSYLIYRMTRGEVFATDPTNACRTLLYDIGELSWSRPLCELFQVPMHALAEVRDSNASFGTTELDGILAAPIPIRGVMGDSQASLFALGCHRVGDTKVTFGTGSSLLMNVGPTVTDPGPGTVSTVAWVIDGQPTYCLEGIITYSAATIQWLRDRLHLIQSAEETEPLAVSVEDNGGVYLVPAFAGLSAPYWSPNARAALVGMTAYSTKAHIVRAALESIAYQVRDVLMMMHQQTGIATRWIQADGGATRNRFLMQFVADLIGAEVQTSLVSESSPLGAALCGAVGQDVASPEELPMSGCAERFVRKQSEKDVDRAYAGWKRAVESVVSQASLAIPTHSLSSE